MEKPLIYVFDDFATAERVREEMLSYGFDPAGVQLNAAEDEAGPVQGNFTVGDYTTVKGGADYKDCYGKPTQRGCITMIIQPVDETQADYAVKLLARYGVSEAPMAGPQRVPGGAASPPR
jgi:hypothetical protein